MKDGGARDAQPGRLRWTLTLVGCVILLFAWRGFDLHGIARWLVTLGGIAIILLAPAAARSMISGLRLTEEGVTGAAFLGPAFIPWSEVVNVFDDAHGITIQSAKRSVRIELSTVTVRSTFGGARIANFGDTDELVVFLLAHIPKSSLLNMRYWLPT
jgi:hypothetical protein